MSTFTINKYSNSNTLKQNILLIAIIFLFGTVLKVLWSQNRNVRTFLVAQWLRIHLPKQGTRVRAPVQEDPTCRGASKPMHHNYRDCTLEPASHNYWACKPQLLSLRFTTTETHVPRARAPQQKKPPQWEARALQQSRPHSPQLRESPRAAMKTQRSQK